MNKVFISQLKAFLLNQLRKPLFYISAIVFAVFIPVNFYLKQQFFSGTGSTDLILLFSSVPYISIILIPVLCFKNSISKYQDFVPLKRWHKILIRFISVLILYTAEILLTVPSALFINLFGKIEAAQLFVSIFCLIFYGACTISLCLFLDELINNSIASLFVSAILLAVFNSAHLLTLYTNTSFFTAAFFKSISFAWHFDAASKGILDTRDILFFTSLTVFFLLITNFTQEIKAGRKIKNSRWYKANITGAIICFLMILNSQRYYKRFDFSKNKTYSLSAYSKQVLDNLTEPLKISYYKSSSLSRLYPQIRDISDFLTTYAQQNNKVSLIIKDPDKDSKNVELLKNYGIAGQQLRNVNTNSTEYMTVYSSIILEYKGDFKIIPFLLSSETLEYDLDRNLRALITGKNPQVNLIIGNGLSLHQDYEYLEMWLTAQGFDVNELNIHSPDFSQRLKDLQGTLYVIGDSEIPIETAIEIENYILSQKGSAFFNISPYSVAIEQDWKLTQNQRTNLVEMLENWGIIFTEKIAADISCAQVSFYSDEDTTEVFNYPMWINLMPQTYCLQGGILYWPTPLVIQEQYKNQITPYLVSSSMAYAIPVERSNREKIIETDPFILRTMNTSNYEKETQLLSVQINGPLQGLYNASSCSESNIIVIPDQYFANTLMCGYSGGQNGDYRNFDFITNILWKLNGEEELCKLQGKTLRDTSLFKITEEQQFIKNRNTTFAVLFFVIPVCIFIIYIFVNLTLINKRKGKLNEK